MAFGNLLKQAQQMQEKMKTLPEELRAQTFDVTTGGGAIRLQVNGAGEFLSFDVNPEFLKEDAAFVTDSILAAFREGKAKADSTREAAVKEVTAGINLPGGLPGGMF